jgi:hypothetical protein
LARARELAETKYSYEAYVERTRQAYDALAGDPDQRRPVPVSSVGVEPHAHKKT